MFSHNWELDGLHLKGQKFNTSFNEQCKMNDDVSLCQINAQREITFPAFSTFDNFSPSNVSVEPECISSAHSCFDIIFIARLDA